MMGMEAAKRYFGEKMFNQLFSYLKNNPLNNLDRLYEISNKAPLMPDHKEKARKIKEAIDQNPAIREYVEKIFNNVDENVQQHLLVNFFINSSVVGIPRQRKLSDELGFNIPFTILVDPTSNCNLKCKGCWAGEYEKHHQLEFEEMDRLVQEAKELGIYFIVMSGGEPMMWPHLFDLCEKHKDVAFMLYTNGTLIDQEKARKMRDAGNITPAISVEGGREATDNRRGNGVFDKIMLAMDNLRENGVIFGFSITITRDNYQEAFSEEFIDLMIEKGCLYGWSFHYIPIGRNPDFSLMITPEERASLVNRVIEIRNNKPIQIADFWNDGNLTQGCIAGGRRYFHINASGEVEPCAFVHFAIDNIRNKPLKEILDNPLFKAYQKRQPFSHNLLRPCPIIDNPEELREIVEESRAYPSHPGADDIIKEPNARKLDEIAENWRQEADKKWEEVYEVKKAESAN